MQLLVARHIVPVVDSLAGDRQVVFGVGVARPHDVGVGVGDRHSVRLDDAARDGRGPAEPVVVRDDDRSDAAVALRDLDSDVARVPTEVE